MPRTKKKKTTIERFTGKNELKSDEVFPGYTWAGYTWSQKGADRRRKFWNKLGYHVKIMSSKNKRGKMIFYIYAKKKTKKGR